MAQARAQHGGCKLVLLDHVTSGTALLIPVARIAARCPGPTPTLTRPAEDSPSPSRCRELGVNVLVDAAHSLGQVIIVSNVLIIVSNVLVDAAHSLGQVPLDV